jgi:4-hydroxyproline epimerase
MAERLDRFRADHDKFRSAVVNEPRGSDAMVGALLCAPVNADSAAGVIFFNNVGYLGMCGHGTIGLVVSLAYLGRIQPGPQRIETPVGSVTAQLHETGEVTVANVASYRLAEDVRVDVRGFGAVQGDVAWGGNWFFLAPSPIAVELGNIETLIDYTWRIRESLTQQEITGADGHEIDHIELFGENGRNFVLCPGKAYDRSPCGTGTSAKVACLYADGKLRPGEVWRQESIVGSAFEASVVIEDGVIYPRIKGSAFVNADATLVLNERDPFCWGIRR